MAFAPDGRTLASASYNGTIRLWNPDTGQLQNSLEGHADGVLSVAFSPDGKILASASPSSTIRLWEVHTGQLLTIFEGHTAVAFSPDGSRLASGHGDHMVQLWDVAPYITLPTAIQSSSPLPAQTTLLANYPNPFNPDTYIPYQLHQPAQVRLTIYDIRGALIREIDLGYRAAGQYLTSARAAHWDGRNQKGQRVASGVYLYRLQAGPVAHVRKMVVIK